MRSRFVQSLIVLAVTILYYSLVETISGNYNNENVITNYLGISTILLIFGFIPLLIFY